jgi:hypothetical protein
LTYDSDQSAEDIKSQSCAWKVINSPGTGPYVFELTDNSEKPTRSARFDIQEGEKRFEPQDEHTRKGLSKGAKAGIGVGTTIGVLAIVGAVIFTFVYRKKMISKKDAGKGGKTELGTSDSPGVGGERELGGVAILEAEGDKPLGGDERAEKQRRDRARELENANKASMRPIELG